MVLPEKIKNLSLLQKILIASFFCLILLVLAGILVFWVAKRQRGAVSPALQERAQQAGYRLVYQADPADTVGRTVLASEERKDASGLNDWYGGEKVWWERGRLYGAYGVGFFQEWEAIKDSEDQYLLVTGPRGKGELKLRVNMSSDRVYDLTKLVVDNLNLGKDVEEPYSTKGMHVLLGEIKHFGLEDLEKILKKGDTVGFTTKVKLEKDLEDRQYVVQGEDGLPLPRTDETGVLLMSNLILRRFGGIEQLGEELGIPISLYE